MRVFLTGASGFVGSRLVPRLRSAGHQTIAAGDELDVRDLESVEASIDAAQPDAVIHLAAQSSVAASWRDPASCFRVNFLGTQNLLLAVERQAPTARVLLVGSADEYRTTEANAPAYTEQTGLRPGSPYARTKAAAELLGSLAAERGLDVMRVRSFNHTGAGQSDAFVASSFAKQIAEMKEAFGLFDEDGDGEITEEDLGKLLAALGDMATETQVHALFLEVDEDGGGSIDFDEFMVMMADRMKERDTEEEVIEAFKVFDADASGYITADELRRILMDIGEDVSEEEMNQLILEADLDGNGRIDYDEFNKLVSDDFISGNAKR